MHPLQNKEMDNETSGFGTDGTGGNAGGYPPPAYYTYPSDFYYPYHIYLSFGRVYRGGYVYRGTHFLDGPSGSAIRSTSANGSSSPPVIPRATASFAAGGSTGNGKGKGSTGRTSVGRNGGSGGIVIGGTSAGAAATAEMRHLYLDALIMHTSHRSK